MPTVLEDPAAGAGWKEDKEHSPAEAGDPGAELVLIEAKLGKGKDTR